VQRRDGGLDLVRSRSPEHERRAERAHRLRDEPLVPACAVLVGQPDQPAPAIEAGRGPGFVQEEQGEQAEHLWLPGHEVMQQAGQRHRLRGQVPPGRLAAGAGQVTLVEHQVDNGQHLGEPAGQVVRIGHTHLTRGGLTGPQQALRHGGLAGQEGRRDFRRGQAADRAQRERYLGVPGQCRMATREYHAEQLIVVRFIWLFRRNGEKGQLFLANPGAPEPVDSLTAGRGGQPAPGVGRDVALPVLEGLDERVLHRVLGQPDVAEPRGQRRADPAGLVPVGPF